MTRYSENAFHRVIPCVIPAPLMRCAATGINASPARLRQQDMEISRFWNNPRAAAVYSGNET